MAGQLKVNGVTLATENASVITLENPQIKDSSNNLILDQSGSKSVLKNVEVVNDSPMMFRNRIINGNQIIDQRNSGSAGTASANTATYATDRWYIYSVGATCGYQRVAGPNTSDYAIQITPASSNTNSIVAQRIENLNCLDLGSQTVTISGKVYIDNASGVTFNTNVYVASSANSSYGSLVSFSSALTSGQYVDFSGTITLGANAINGIEVDFSFLSAAGKTIKLTNLQLEIGTVATPFEHRPIGTELALCQRYFFQNENKYMYFNARNSDNAMAATIPFPVEMRVTPSITKVSDPAGFTFTWNNVCKTCVSGGGTSPSNAYTDVCGVIQASGEL
jgi:hypothetical protein